jgi:inner membrane protein
MPWWVWATLSALIGLAELHAPGSYLIWIAIGAALTAAIQGAYGAPITVQITTFAVASALSCFAGYFVYRRADGGRPDGSVLNQRGLRMVGSRGYVCADIVNGEGKVRLGDTVWLAEGPALSEGDPIIVRSVQGARVIVELAATVPTDP